MISMPRLQAGGLLVRLAALMTFALLPLGLIALYQTNAVVDEATRLSHASLLDQTERAASRERELLQRAGGATEGVAAAILPVLDDRRACSGLLQAFTEGPNPFTFAAFITPDGRMICASDGKSRDVSERWMYLKARQTAQLSFALGRDLLGEGGSFLLATSPVQRDGILLGYVSIAIPHKVSAAGSGNNWPDRGIQYVTIDAQGEILSSSVPEEEAAQVLPVSVPRRDLLAHTGETFFEDDRSGSERFFAVSGILPGQVSVVGSWPVENAMTAARNPASLMTIAFPVLMWLAGISVAVLGLQQMVIRHLSALRRAMRRYALGEREDPRLELLNPPREFEEAEQSFNRMVAILSEAERRRELDLEEKTILLREVHHRVKNNLQLVASIMNMQGRTAQTPEARRMLSQLQRRVRGLATIHRSLNTNPDITTVDSRDLVQELITEIGSMNAGTGQEIMIETDLAPVPLSQDQGVTLSMLVSEAMTNAVKYLGVPDGGRPRIDVRLHETAPDWLELEITNTKGQPLAAEEEAIQGTGIGARLMMAFTAQLDGIATTGETETAYTYRLGFPVAAGAVPPAARDTEQDHDAEEPAA
ncbi:histidine kinase dimerization/phosphoacceptor domain -containing protein [Leisingera sp. SS27]|uniref:sensor histidine kinase n=1 Tax=Leisingera sp. SS27 TaxID=2979462 RepID=UPI00232D94B2|nr:histidine kinase dimerization/phosphoacceptor domain -containing protein [Leisingera sp. SS27]MDC0658517.1 histidine kinase dimerization/phosphoacceptor domain -containing protein [Leisingera sp. SS27]